MVARGLVLSALLVFTALARLTAQSAHGTVVDDATNAAVPAATLQIFDRSGSLVHIVGTDARGAFAFQPEIAGQYILIAHAFGYEAVTAAVEVAEQETVEIEIRLTPEPLRLEPIGVTAEGHRTRLVEVGFYDRRKKGIGRFIEANNIETRANFGVTDLLRTEPAVNVLYDSRQQRWIATFRAAARMSFDTSPCFPLLVLDGTRVSDSRILDDIVHPENIAAIELYPNSNGAPVQYAGLSAPCGVIMIWTHR